MTGEGLASYLHREAGAISAWVSMDDAEKYLLPGQEKPDYPAVLICAVPYLWEDEDRPISRYARGKDYHRVLRNLFDQGIAACGHENYAAYADISPFCETRLASAAGLGQVGKNGLLLTREYGSYVFVGEILSAADDSPVALREPEPCCGCGACIQACPSPGNCLSGISQKRGELSPEEIALLREHHIFWGCDYCQSACPANTRPGKAVLESFRTNLISDPAQLELTGLSNREIERRYADRAFVWRGGGVLKRNAWILFDPCTEKPPERA